MDDLDGISGIGAKKREAYGEGVLAVIEIEAVAAFDAPDPDHAPASLNPDQAASATAIATMSEMETAGLDDSEALERLSDAVVLTGERIADVVAEALRVAGGVPPGRAVEGGTGGIHLDIDIDVCDRAVAPGCPASVPGGLQAWELRALVRALATDPRVRSADIVEVHATADAPDGRTVRLAALCVLELLAGLHARKGSR